MFGFGGKGKDGPKLVGAKEKMLRAQMLKGGRDTAEKIKSGKEGPPPNPMPAVVLIYVMSVAMSYLLTIGPFKTGVSFHLTGDSQLDRALFGPGVTSYTGTPETDEIIAAFIRGAFFFMASGLVPLLSHIWIRLLDKARANPFLVIWGMPVGLTLAVIAFQQLIFPLLAEVFHIFA